MEQAAACGSSFITRRPQAVRELREHHGSIPHTDWACEIHGQACIVLEMPLSVDESALIRPMMETGNVRRPNRRANLQPACVAPTLGGAFLPVNHLHAFICQCMRMIIQLISCQASLERGCRGVSQGGGPSSSHSKRPCAWMAQWWCGGLKKGNFKKPS